MMKSPLSRLRISLLTVGSTALVLAALACAGGDGSRKRSVSAPECWEFPADFTQTGSNAKISCQYDDKANALRCSGGRSGNSVKYYQSKKDFILEGANLGLVRMTRHTYQRGIFKFDFKYTYDDKGRLVTEKEVGNHRNVDIIWNKWDSIGRNIAGVENAKSKCGPLNLSVAYDDKTRKALVTMSPVKKSKACNALFPRVVTRIYDPKLNLVEQSDGRPGIRSTVEYKIGKTRKACWKSGT